MTRRTAWIFASPLTGFVMATVLAAALIAARLSVESFSLDESVSVTLARLSWGDFVAIVAERETNMILYHLLLRGWIDVGGSNEGWVRALSALFAVATIPLLGALAQRLFNSRTAVFTVLLLAVNPLFIHYAQQGRAFTLSIFLVTASSYLLVRALQAPSRATWLGYAVVTALAPYAFLLALLTPVAHVAALLALPAARRPSSRTLAAVATGIGALMAPLGALLVTSSAATGISWAAGNLPGRMVTAVRELIPTPLAVLLVAMAVSISLVVLLGWRHRLERRSAGGWSVAFVLLSVVVPLLSIAAASFLFTPLFVTRYFAFLVPFVVLLLAWGLLRLRPRVALAAGGAVVALAVAGILQDARSTPEDWRGAAAYVTEAARPGDGVLFYAPYVRVPFELYAARAGGLQLDPVNSAIPLGSNTTRFLETMPVTTRAVRAGSTGHRRIWVVLSHAGLYGQSDPGLRAVRRGLAGSFAASGRQHFAGIEIIRFDAVKSRASSP